MGKTADKGRIAHLNAEIDLIDRLIEKYDKQRADKQEEIQKILDRAAVLQK